MVNLHLLGDAPRLMSARLAGLCAAVRAQAPVYAPHLAAPPARDPRLVDVAVGLIRITPGRQARLAAAADLAMVAAMHNCPALRDTDQPADPEGPAVAPGAPWQRIASALASECHPLTCWSRLLQAGHCTPGHDGATTFDLIHLLHNQLGLSARDEQRVHAGLIRSLSRRRTGPARSSRSHRGVAHPGAVRPQR
ncbi:hypothetical protein [Micromonospora vulcania]|uniref:Uncharacterized protein n=1 Tax=Micromonospora vulcania TaxID=1441873 RepID=A0ABW1HCV9_9ACTN